jgi:hypothetical protein
VRSCPVVVKPNIGLDDGRQVVETVVGVDDPKVVESVQILRDEGLTQGV